MNQKVAIVTGASTGLGLELATALAVKGFTVVAVSRSEGHDPRWKELKKNGILRWIAGDVSLEATVQAAITEANRVGHYSLLINNAGTGHFSPAHSISCGEIQSIVASNLVGTILFCSKSLELFLQKSGTIVNVMSTSAKVGRENESVYCAAKWGVRGYTEALRVELKGKPVRLLSVYPGGMKTEFFQKAGRDRDLTAHFMEPAEVALTIVESIFSKPSLQVNELVLNRI